MSLRVTEERLATPEEWDRVWVKCDYATYFQSREWADVWQKYTQGDMRPDAKMITFSDGKRALLPFSSRRIVKGLLKQYISSPAGTFGGWISDDDLSSIHDGVLYEYIIKHFKILVWRINPYCSLKVSPYIQGVKKDETHTLNLEYGFDHIYKGWTKGHSSAARKARKAGVDIREAITLSDWESYYRIYEESLRRWGESATSRYGWNIFKYMYDLSSSNIKLWLAIFEGKVVAGAMCLYATKHVGYWHGAASSEYFNLRPVNLLMYEIIKKACKDEYGWFDFNPSGGHEGVKAFKKSFGTDSLACPVITRNYRTISIASRIATYTKKVIQ